MNEQQLADLFSEQVDRMLNGDSVQLPDDTGDLQSLLDTVQPTQTQFQASSAAQAAFHSQLASWFGLTNGGTPMILGLSKAWFISIVVAVTVFVGGGLIAVIATTSVVVMSANSQLPGTDEPTVEPTDQPTDQPTEEPTDQPTEEPTSQPTDEPTAEPTDDPSNNGGPTLIFHNNVVLISYCGGAYNTQQTLVNTGSAPVNDAALAWEVVDGADWVDNVTIDSPNLMQAFNQTSIANTSLNAESLPVQSSIANFNSISVDQDIDLDVKVKVKDTWWSQSDGTKIKIKLSVKNKIDLSYDNGDDDDDGDLDRGHGNDPDGYDEDNPGRGHKKGHDDSYASQTITIVKQHSSQVYTFSGIAHSYDSQSYLIDGNIVSFDDCTGVPTTFVVGTQVQIIALLQPDGTFIALNVITLNSGGSGIDVIISGDQGPDDSSDDGGSSGGGGGRGGGGKGGSKGGS